MSGLDCTFAHTDRAVVLEDDVLPHPSFLPWAARMLERFHDDDEVAMVSGHNLLGHWGDAAMDHIRTRRGSVWGWATTASAWRRINAVDLSGDPTEARRDVAQLALDPLVAEHHAIALEAYRHGTLRAWDVIWLLRLALGRGTAIVSSINLVRNTGIGSDATRTTYAGDFSALVPVGEARPPGTRTNAAADSDAAFDRAALLVQLLACCVEPSMAWRLARLVDRGAKIPLDSTARLYLAPFAVPGESIGLLEHLARQGVTSPAFETLLSTMRQRRRGERGVRHERYQPGVGDRRGPERARTISPRRSTASFGRTPAPRRFW